MYTIYISKEEDKFITYKFVDFEFTFNGHNSHMGKSIKHILRAGRRQPIHISLPLKPMQSLKSLTTNMK